jgi:hypothetical protein
MNLICPHCNSRLELSALAEDMDARKLFALVKEAGEAGSALVAYLGLFKPQKQALRWSRALKLAQEVTAIAERFGAQHAQLATACLRTVAALDERRKGSEWQPLSNHRYFEKVLAAVMDEPADLTAIASARGGPKSKRQSALELLDED